MDTGIPVSKADQIIYSTVAISDAQRLANGMTIDSNKTGSLLFGIQWDLTCKFLEEKSILTQADIKSNGKKRGNYRESGFILNRGKYLVPSDSSSEWKEYTEDTEDFVIACKASSDYYHPVLFTTGASEQARWTNIYDFAGNLSEITLEQYTSNSTRPKVERGGGFGNAPGFGGWSYFTGNGQMCSAFRCTIF